MADDAGTAESVQGKGEADIRESALLRDHSLFDPDWYLAHNPDVAAASLDAVDHFVTHGWREGRDPGPGFSVQWYLAAYADVAASNLNPLVHYIGHGLGEGRLPHPDALVRTESVAPEIGTSTSGSDSATMNAREAEEVALVAGHRLFDAEWYAMHTPLLAQSGLSPAAHFILFGGYEGRSPGPNFDLLAYLDRRSDVEQAGVNALVHFINHGEREGCAIDAS